MKKIYLILFLCGFLFYGCEKEDYLAGEVKIVDDFKKEFTLQGKEIKLEGEYAGYMSVFDSLMLFCPAQQTDYQLYIYNLNTKEQLKPLFKTGRGPNEFMDITHFEQYVANSASIKLWTYNDYKSYSLVNLTRSLQLESDSLVIDSIIPIEARKIKASLPTCVYALENDMFITHTQCEKTYYDDPLYIPGQYTLYRSSLDHPTRTLKLFNKPVINPAISFANTFYASHDRIKPDKNKIAMAMRHMAQINILDLKTGELKGFRLKGTPGFSYLREHPDNFRTYYHKINVDDQYIYAIYEDKLSFNNRMPQRTNTTIHVYDWNGNPICKLIFKEVLEQTTLDPATGILYGKTYMEEIFQYDLKAVLSKL